MSYNSDQFVYRLKASLQFMSQESVDLYKEQLARRHLTASQWGKALNAVILANRDGKLPTMHSIFLELDRQEKINRPESDMGWASFRILSSAYVIRVKAYEGKWIIADLTRKDNKGEVIHVQPNFGKPLMDNIPADAMDFIITADNPCRNDDIPSPNEVRTYMASIEANLVTMGRK